MSVEEIYKKLSEPFPPECVHWRVGATTGDKSKGIALAYLDARDVMDRLDQVVGWENWEDDYIETAKGRLLCSLSLHVGDLTVTKSDGAGDTDVEGEKGAISDAFKRAAVKFGVGRYLYRLENNWVPIEPYGRSFRIKGSPPQLPAWALPQGAEAPKPRGPVEQPEEESKPNTSDVLEKFAALYKRGMQALGQETFLNRANIIIENKYGGLGAKDLPLDKQRALFQDLKKMIDNNGGE